MIVNRQKKQNVIKALTDKQAKRHKTSIDIFEKDTQQTLCNRKNGV